MQFTMQFCTLRKRSAFAYRLPVLANLYRIPILVDVHQLCAGLAAKLGDAPFVAAESRRPQSQNHRLVQQARER